MTSNEVQAMEQEVLEALSRLKSPVRASEVIGVLREKGCDEGAIREAIWRLIDRRELGLTPDRKLEVPQAV